MHPIPQIEDVQQKASRSLLRRVFLAGIPGDLPHHRAQKELVINFIWLLYVGIPLVLSLVNLASMAFDLSPPAEEGALRAYFFANSTTAALGFLLFALRARNPRLLWSVLFSLLVTTYVVWSAIALEPATRAEAFLFVGFFIPFVMLHSNRAALVFTLVVTFSGLIFVLWFRSRYAPLFPMPSMLSISGYAFPIVVSGQLVAGIAYLWQAVDRAEAGLESERRHSDRLLHSILPDAVVDELKREGKVTPRTYEQVTILFADFVGFTHIASDMQPADLVAELDSYFRAFDEITSRHRVQRLKTIGDGYMCAGGVPEDNTTHPVDCVLAGLAMRDFVNRRAQERRAKGLPTWEVRIGINTGTVTSGVVGTTHFAYDIWGDAVNVASRMESAGEAGKLNISGATHELVGAFFECQARGAVEAKNKGTLEMYFADALRPEYATANGEGNAALWAALERNQDIHRNLKF